MVKVIDYKERKSEDRTFYVLEVQGGVELILNQQTGQHYATAKKAQIISTFDKPTCEMLIGTELEGSIEKVKCEPYEYVSKVTGELLKLEHKYVFVPIVPTIDKNRVTERSSISSDTNLNSKVESQVFEDAF